MNAKVAKMLRKTGRNSKDAKSWWNGLTSKERGELRRDYNKFRAITSSTGHHDAVTDAETKA
jgi:hypothetical protein